MKRFLAVGALLLVLGASARADSFTAHVSGPGQNLGNGQLASAFSVTDTTLPAGPFTAFCADLQDHVGTGSATFTGTLTTGPMPNPLSSLGSPLNVIWANGYTDVGNRLDYLLNQLMAPSLLVGLTSAQSAALQAGIWEAMDHYVTTDPAGANAASGNSLVTDVVKVLTGSTFLGVSGWAALDAMNTASNVYHASLSYGSTNEFLIVPAATGSNPTPLQYQVLVGVTSAELPLAVVPEPSTFAIAGAGALGFLAYGWKRRKRS